MKPAGPKNVTSQGARRMRAAALSIVLVSCAAQRPVPAETPRWPCVKELGQNYLLHITQPAALQHGDIVCVAVIEGTWPVRGSSKPLRFRDYDGGDVGDWTYRREWDLDGDGTYDCREDECVTKRPHGPSPNCVSRLVNGQWKDEPDVLWCVDPALLGAAQY